MLESRRTQPEVSNSAKTAIPETDPKAFQAKFSQVKPRQEGIQALEWQRYIGRCFHSGHPTTGAAATTSSTTVSAASLSARRHDLPARLEYVPCRRLVAGGVNKVRPAGLRPPPEQAEEGKLRGHSDLSSGGCPDWIPRTVGVDRPSSVALNFELSRHA